MAVSLIPVPSRHDHDAGGDREVLEHKATLRDRIWTAMQEDGLSRFPGAENRIPNFTGAEDAAERLRGLDAWQRADALKSNPDSPQWPVRQRALEDGKLVYLAVPKLADERPFIRLDPGALEESPRKASSIKGAARNGEPVEVEELQRLDLVVTGCVGVSLDGARLGKGGGFSDLEFAVAVEAGVIDDDTIVVTTVHEVQVLEVGEVPVTSHDVPLDVIVTPERVIDCRDRRGPRPDGVRWGELTDEKIASIPLLQRLRNN
ncbi:MAG: 5-formyltetrahydrofolate cyclo-ligase [Actinobacteria bacterium]|nr:5-formyltetrahydrofolate cyclo-ligase [Actinomycetota bacterium]